jgi:hypothetical protein
MVRRFFTIAGQIGPVNCAARQSNPMSKGRHQPRTHLFVAATLYADAGTTPVNIRNMSQTGALIDAAVLPEVGCRVILKRGPLQAAGNIAWRAGRRAGVRLEADVCVADWMARLGNSGQDRVDALVAIVRNDVPRMGAPAPVATETLSVEGELAMLRTELTRLERGLVGDPAVIANHPELQTFDISLQRIDRILKRLCAGG